ncbi:MAG TPA: DUF481 domain-containing protein [Chitinophagales bacterium]|nr:DUF481 domain-containing protein [Chitinophagales bacterium]
MKKLIPFIVFNFILVTTFSQIVNIERERYQTDTTGWKGNLDVGLAIGKQTKTYFVFSTSAHVQYKSKKHLYLLLGSVDLLKTKAEDLVNAGFLHFRYNYKLKKSWVRWEAFTQVQFNKANGLRMRFLIGTGPRFKVVQKEKFKTYIGALYMYEHEVNIKRTEKLDQVRFSGYLSFSLRPFKQLEFISTTYYQPNVTQIKDYRISTDNSMNIRFHKNITFAINFRMNYDSRPPVGAVTNLTYLQSNTLKVDF